jgi:hypothetical protein
VSVVVSDSTVVADGEDPCGHEPKIDPGEVLSIASIPHDAGIECADGHLLPNNRGGVPASGACDHCRRRYMLRVRRIGGRTCRPDVATAGRESGSW